jgi:hypothetical protein
VFAIGSFLGSLHLGWWLDLGNTQPVGLVTAWGWAPALLATLAALAVVALGVAWYVRGANMALKRPTKPLFVRKWVVGAVLLAVLATLNLIIAGQPWGVVYGFGLWAAKIANATGAVDLAANWFWSQPGNAARLHETVLLDVTSITNIGILGGALVEFEDPGRGRRLGQRQTDAGHHTGGGRGGETDADAGSADPAPEA